MINTPTMRFLSAIPLLFSLFSTTLFGQVPQLDIQARVIHGLPALHSFAWGKWNNNLLLVGGRTDGLHQKQPFAAFHPRNRNDSLFVINLVTNQIWRAPLLDLPASIKDQLQSTNMQFHQQGDELICIGGYGYGDASKKFTTYPSLLRLKIPAIIDAVQQNKPWTNQIQQINDPQLAVCGGYLGQIKEIFYLIGGHRFDGKYNPHGPDHGPGFTQQYTDQVRRFTLTKKGKIKWLSPITDTALLHRRDMNVLPQHRPDGSVGLTIFSGVFKPETELPYKTLVDIDKNKVREVPNFEQQYSHYHNAHLPIYQKSTATSYSIFFGGIAEFYRNEKGEIQQNNLLPFTRNISVVTRSGDRVEEKMLSIEFPELLGASSAFIPTQTEWFDEQGILQWDKLPLGRNKVGFILGGIVSTGRIIFWPGEKDSSRANEKIWEIYLIKNAN